MKKIISFLMSAVIIMTSIFVLSTGNQVSAQTPLQPDMKVTGNFARYQEQYILNETVFIKAEMQYMNAFDKFDRIIIDLNCNKNVVVDKGPFWETLIYRQSETQTGYRYEILAHDPLVDYDGALFVLQVIAKGEPDVSISAVGITKDGREQELVLDVELPNNKVYEKSELPQLVADIQPPVFGYDARHYATGAIFIYAPQTVAQIRQMLSSSDGKSKIVHIPKGNTSGKYVADNDVFALEFEGKLCDYIVVHVIGDANSDGRITPADARSVLRYSAKLRDDARAYDVNADKVVTAADARKILRVSAKLDNFAAYVTECEVGYPYYIMNLKTAGSGSYKWQYTVSDPDAFEVSQSIAPPENTEILPGTPYNQTFIFTPLKSGEYKVHFELVQPWSKDVANSFDMVFVVN